MKTPYSSMYSTLKTNRLIVWLVVLCATLSSMFSGWMAYSIYQESLQNAFAISTTGEVIPLKLVDQNENLEVEALAHLELFHAYFYDIDASNYDTNLEKALWLGNNSVDNIYRQKKTEGVYNRLIQYSLVQNVLGMESKVDLNAYPYAFQTTLVFEINRGSITDTYELITTGKLIQVDRNFPHNPHGLLITDFFEKSLRKIDAVSR
ncbi:conjugal transfer protein TraK [Leeuwenhoekiella parthenopeia]|uniref:Conjugal transfer protein TraK n=1 Tax=Leeuwenhoekiella parthenopeia TaxID=2890320 RepID=A0ABS8H0R0_9FLAO|nr:conjugal transfer protein TraK [Leeuwenhoekiella parthenopeia]MCC4214403.1 conjugal transfer protein TraK [Leeuwenhoekiella parthenopeia]